jgi:hypothetical protein
MRDDMAKVIVERPRRGGGVKFPRNAASWQRTAPEEWPNRQSIRRCWGAHQKFLNENLAPLRRFLRRRCGRPWDLVYSEISQRIDASSAVQLHVLQHLFDYVCVDTTLRPRDGAVCDSTGEPLQYWRTFYVHPVTRILCPKERPPRWRWRHVTDERDVVQKDASHQFRRVNGIWYEVTIAPIPQQGEAALWDVIQHKTVNFLTFGEWIYSGVHRYYAAAKRQLNKREIRRLRNGS